MESRPSPRNSDTLRLFWALPLPVDLQRRLQEWLRTEAVPSPGARWVAVENLHLTLAFLGSRRAGEFEAIYAAGRAALADRDGFRLRTAGLGAFPSSRSARVFWLGLEPEPALASLVESLQASMRGFGCLRKEGAFLPHLTLARFKPPGPAPVLAEFPAVDFRAEAVHLFQSETRPEGSVYRSLGAVPLSL